MVPSIISHDSSSSYDLPVHHHQYHTTSQTPPHKDSLCYFTYIPASPSHWSDETPLPSPDLSATKHIIPDPYNPLLALRIAPLSPPQTMEASRLLQLQTAAAHMTSPQRPRPQPHQDVLELSDDSISSRTSSDSSSSSSTPKVCSRCQTNYGQFIQFSMNSFYCMRCAKITGYCAG